MSDFTWGVDLKDVQWGATIRLNSLRGFAAGIVWGGDMLILGGPSAGSMSGTPWWSLPFLLGVGYVATLPFFFGTAKLVSAVAGDIGMLGVRLATFVVALAIAVGDPLVFLLHRRRPAWVPVEQFKPFNATMILWVMDPEKATLMSTY